MCGDPTGTGAGSRVGGLSRWKLHQQLTRTRDRPLHSVTFELEIRTSAEVPSNAGAIILHFMDIRRNLYGLNLDGNLRLLVNRATFIYNERLLSLNTLLLAAAFVRPFHETA
jgi:hypothetical protein